MKDLRKLKYIAYFYMGPLLALEYSQNDSVKKAKIMSFQMRVSYVIYQ